MRLLLGSLLVPALLIAGAGSASAQAPSNDARAAAIQLAPRTTVTAHTDETTPPGTEPGENATCGNTQYDGTLWWWFTGDGKIMRVETVEPATNYDTVVSIQHSNGTLVGCNDNFDGLTQSLLDFPTTRGEQYFVQVGSVVDQANKFFVGDVAVTLESAPANDDRALAMTVAAGQAVSADTFLANLDANEVSRCGDRNFGRTVWFRFNAPSAGQAAFTSQDAITDTVLTVYRGSDTVPLACDDNSLGDSRSARVSVAVTPGEYLIQVGGFDDGNGPQEGQFNFQAQFAEDLDLDKDGIPRPGDCNDNDKNVHPGAVDVPGDKIDQNCDGADAPFPHVQSAVHFTWLTNPRWTIVRSVSVVGLPPGASVTLTCRGRGCPFARRGVLVAPGAARLARRGPFGRRKLRPGTIVEIRTTAPGYV